jgi:hypothetical protein
MSPIIGPAGLRGARFQAVFARSSYVGIGWSLWGFLPHFLPQHPQGTSSKRRRFRGVAFGACSFDSTAGLGRVTPIPTVFGTDAEKKLPAEERRRNAKTKLVFERATLCMAIRAGLREPRAANVAACRGFATPVGTPRSAIRADMRRYAAIWELRRRSARNRGGGLSLLRHQVEHSSDRPSRSEGVGRARARQIAPSLSRCSRRAS